MAVAPGRITHQLFGRIDPGDRAFLSANRLPFSASAGGAKTWRLSPAFGAQPVRYAQQRREGALYGLLRRLKGGAR